MKWIVPLFLLFYLALDLYAFQAFRSLSKAKLTIFIYWLLSFALIFSVVYDQIFMTDSMYKNPWRMILYSLLLVMVVTKLFLALGMLLEDGYRFGVAIYQKLTGKPRDRYIPSRRKFVATIAIGLAALPFSTLLYGMIRGKYNFRVLKYELEFDDLPDAFDGYTITQFSDLHVGSWYNKKEFSYAMELINDQKSDVILFTGDLVNDVVGETTRWKSLMATLHAPDGVFSVLGNHDYGDYHRWSSKEEKIENLKELKEVQAKAGWKLLNNEHVLLQRGRQHIALVGVENWGNGNFKKAGDLDKASEGLEVDDFKLLMSHDPTHWDYHVKNHVKNFHLTFSGHTHGMQYGVEIPGFVRWSPSQFRYDHWAGLYKENNKYLYVNRGLGVIGYSGRFGVWPEVTVIKLKKKDRI